MQIIETYGKYIEKWANTNPDRARVLLKLGWEAQNLKYKFTPDKRLLPADRYLAHLMMNTMLMPLKNPQECAIVSIFTPCEILHEAGLHPYNVEAFSCYLSASNAERAFLQQAENPLVEFLPVGMKEPIVFHTRFLQKSTCGKQRENFSFQQKETALSGKAVRL